MTACAVAALTVYDMCKSADRTMTVEHLALWFVEETLEAFVASAERFVRDVAE